MGTKLPGWACPRLVLIGILEKAPSMGEEALLSVGSVLLYKMQVLAVCDGRHGVGPF